MRAYPAIILAALLLMVCPSFMDGTEASETCPDGTVYGYETHGSGHPDYYCVITSAETDQSILHLPSVLEGYDVRTLASHAFDGCAIASAVIPKNLKEIEDGAFAGCPLLTDVYFMGDRPIMGDPFPEGVRVHTIPGSTGWTGTEAIDVVTVGGVDYAMLPDGAVVTGGIPSDGVLTIRDEVDGVRVVKVDDYSFAGVMREDGTVDRRSDIDRVEMPEGLLSIGQRAFYYNDVRTAPIPSTVRDIQDEAFRACHHLESVTFPGGLAYIGFEAFRDCHSIEALDVPGTIGFVGDGAFYICESLESLKLGVDAVPRMFGYCVSLEDVEFGDGVEGIGASSFYQCESLKTVVIPDRVKVIGREAFRDCISLISVDLNMAEDIGRMAFRGCESLRTLAVPSDVRLIEGYAFADCIGLQRIDALGMAPKGDDTSFLNVDAVIHCKKDAADSWKDAGFGLDVVGDLEDGPPAAVLVAIVLLIVLFAFSSAIVMKVRRRMRT
jgi:hypothetical protein